MVRGIIFSVFFIAAVVLLLWAAVTVDRELSLALDTSAIICALVGFLISEEGIKNG